MPKQHIVQQGECITSIAFQYGFFLDTVWNDSGNTGLRDIRTNPYELVPGDVVTIPDKRVKQQGCSTGARYQFVRKGVPEMLCLKLTLNNEPRAGVPYTLIIDGAPFKGVTDGDGGIKHPLKPNAGQCRLLIGNGSEHYEVLLRQLQPVTQEAGLRARLANLHYLQAGDSDAEVLKQAISAFQLDQSLPVTGTADDATREKLQDQHGS